MNCPEIQTLLHAYGDGELDAARSLGIEQHLHACPDCREVFRNQTTLKNAVRAGAPHFKAPAGLRRRILGEISRQSAAETPAKSLPRSYRNSIAAGLAMAACLAIGFFVAESLALHQEERAGLVRELTASHVRSLLADHLMDVVSTDQHTVKPWFDGKLDFAPPVNDLAANGYPLAGGRLDYISGRTVAVLVYKKQKHFINLFVWPSASGEETVRLASKSGYNMANWIHAGMDFWAVSDVNQGSLVEFAKLVTDQSAPAPKPGD